MPDIVGLTLAEAELRVEGAGLILATVQELSPSQRRKSRRERTVSWQQPEAGVQRRRMETVTAGFGSRGGGLSGDREPRNPLPKPRSELAELLQRGD